MWDPMWLFFMLSNFSTNEIYTTNLVLHLQIYDDASTKIGLEIGPSSMKLWLMKVRIH